MDLSAVVEHHPVAVRVLALTIVFASGYFEAFVLKSRALACTTWFLCLGALTAWIAFSGTLLAVAIAAGVFMLGLFLLIAYYQLSESG